MKTHVSEWTEEIVLSLPPHENDTFERKGAALLDLTHPRANEGEILNELAKQLSAFANTGGGQIIYGLDNTGAVDNGGIARSVRGRQSTKEWLENIIPTLTDFEILGFNVYEILPKSTGSSQLDSNKSIYVIDVPDSERAPHQSKRDHKYYVRLGSGSQPASHRLIEDIRNRTRHPILEVHDPLIIGAVSEGSHVSGLRSEFDLNMSIRVGVRNKGRVRASNACLQLSAAIPLSTNLAEGREHFPRSASVGMVLFELKNPLYPEMGVVFGCSVKTHAAVQVLPQSLPLTLAGVNPDEVSICFASFADSAPSRMQEFRLTEIDPDRRIAEVVEQEVKRIRSSSTPRGHHPRTGAWS
jgi:hypothetical protein